MDTPAASAVPRAWPGTGDARRELVVVGAASTVVLAALAAAVGFVAMLTDHSAEFSLFARPGGWQLYAVQAAVGVGVLGAGVPAAVVLARRYRSLSGRTPHRRAVILVSLLPGLLLGGAAAVPMRTALSWASQHTAAADAARRQLEQWQEDYRKAPPAAPSSLPPATGEVAQALLRATDLGNGWYPAMTPSPAGGVISRSLAVAGVTSVGRSNLAEQHWSGKAWSLDRLLLENAYAFSSHPAAQRYATTEWSRPRLLAGAASAAERRHVRRVAGVTVWEHVTTSSFGTDRSAIFVVGRLALTLITSARDGDRGRNDFDALVVKTVSHALALRRR